MKALLSKRYAIKVGTGFLSSRQKRVVVLAAPPDESRYEDVDFVTLWKNKRDAQAIADHIRHEFDATLGPVIVTEFPLITIR